VHYYPTQDYTEKYDNDAKVIAIPPHWQDQPTTHYEIPLQMHGTTMEEPWCPNNWCGTVNSLKWSGPGEEGYVIDPNSEKRVLDPARIKCVDKDDQCEEWASWDSNECVKNRSFMRTNCQKSCGLCGTLPSQGLDEL
jgi:ShK domain-like